MTINAVFIFNDSLTNDLFTSDSMATINTWKSTGVRWFDTRISGRYASLMWLGEDYEIQKSSRISEVTRYGEIEIRTGIQAENGRYNGLNETPESRLLSKRSNFTEP